MIGYMLPPKPPRQMLNAILKAGRDGDDPYAFRRFRYKPRERTPSASLAFVFPMPIHKNSSSEAKG